MGYRKMAKVLHWAIAVLIVGQLAGGWYMTHLDLVPSTEFRLYQLHKSFGFVVLVLAVFRLYWRLTHRAPPLPVAMPGWQKRVAVATHWLFYGLMIGVPLAGWVLVSASPYQIPTKLFFFLPIPHLPLPVSETLAGIASETHEYLAFATAGLLVLHVAAGLKHALVEHDDVWTRMVPQPTSLLGRTAKIGVAAFLATGFAAFAIGFVTMSGDHEEEDADIISEQTVDLTPADGAWVLDPSASRVTLTGSAFGGAQTVEVPGVSGAVVLDPKSPEDGGTIAATIPLGALTGSGEAPGTLRGTIWFDVASFPTASFESSDIVGVEDAAYLASGMLTIKGVSRPVELPFVLDIDAEGVARAVGVVDIDRTLFGLGSAGSDIGQTVQVRVEVVGRQTP